MSILPFTTDKPIVCLAPMDGYTDSAFRQLVKELNPRILVFTEMVNANAIRHLNTKTATRFHSEESESPLIVQLFGKEPDAFADAAKTINQTKSKGIDINMGCPAKKILKSGHGSDLIRNPDLAADIVKAVKDNTDLPVSVKTRLGWSDDSTLIDFCQKMEKAGADFITIHGRTVKQAFSGISDWQPIYKLKKSLNIPVVGNGDIHNEIEAQEKIKNLNGVMIGRAAFGNPFLFCDFNSENWGSSIRNEKSESIPNPQTLRNQYPWIIKHCELAIDTKGEHVGMLEMRKHLVKYCSGIPDASRYRSRLVQVETIDQVKLIFEEILWESENQSE